jgi:FkbM family methyltransferase
MIDRRTAVLRSMPLLRRLVQPRMASLMAKYLYLGEALERYGIDLVIDVGANVGQFGLALRAIGYRGRILSFEPFDQAYRALARTAAQDGRWDVMNTALDDAEGSRELAVMRSSVFSSFHTPASTEGATAQFSGQNVVDHRQEVPVRRLDAVLDERSLRPLLGRALLKCDTQGHDRHVLEGFDYAEEVALLQIELSAVPVYEEAPSMTELLSYVEERGFAPILFSPVNRAPDGSAIEFDYLGVNRAVAKAPPSGAADLHHKAPPSGAAVRRRRPTS